MSPDAYRDHLGIMQRFWGLDEAAVASLPHVTRHQLDTVMAAFTYHYQLLENTEKEKVFKDHVELYEPYKRVLRLIRDVGPDLITIGILTFYLRNSISSMLHGDPTVDPGEVSLTMTPEEFLTDAEFEEANRERQKRAAAAGVAVEAVPLEAVVQSVTLSRMNIAFMAATVIHCRLRHDVTPLEFQFLWDVPELPPIPFVQYITVLNMVESGIDVLDVASAQRSARSIYIDLSSAMDPFVPLPDAGHPMFVAFLCSVLVLGASFFFVEGGAKIPVCGGKAHLSFEDTLNRVLQYRYTRPQVLCTYASILGGDRRACVRGRMFTMFDAMRLYDAAVERVNELDMEGAPDDGMDIPSPKMTVFYGKGVVVVAIVSLAAAAAIHYFFSPTALLSYRRTK